MNSGNGWRGWKSFKELEVRYLALSVEERTVQNVTTKLTRQFFKGQAVSQVSKNPRGGMYGRVLEDEGGGNKVLVCTRNGNHSKCTREYLKLYDVT